MKFYLAIITLTLAATACAARPSTSIDTTPAAITATALPPLPTAAPTLAQWIVRRDISYCLPGDEKQKLDLYLPPSNGRTPPVLLYFHGQPGNRGTANPLQPFVQASIAVADVDYSDPAGGLDQSLPSVQDSKCAVRYLRANAQSLGIDARHFGAYGCSFGSYLAAMLGLSAGQAELEGSGGNPDVSSSVQAVAAVSGIYDFAAQFGRAARPETKVPALLDPIHYAGKGSPPFLIIHGDQDRTVDVGQAVELYSQLRASGAPAQLVVLTNGGHCLGAGPTQPSLSDTIKIMVEFFKKALSP